MDINDIARRAGVSRATVSRFLNDGYVSQEKRQRIQRIIDETGYIPSKSAQQLRTGKTNLVGVIIPKINSHSVSRMVAGITDGLAKVHYHAVLANTNNDLQTEVAYLNVFARRHHVDGVILVATVFTKEHLRAIGALNIPVVVLGQRLPNYPSVYQDDYGAMHDITRLVLPKSKVVAYLGVIEEDQAAGSERHRGFIDACGEAGITVRPEAQRIVEFSSDAGYFGAEEILADVPDVDTIVCATDDIAFGAMMCMREYGKRVPEDVQITGIGDSQLSRIIQPSLTTAHLAYYSSGRAAAQTLLAQIDGNSPGAREIKMAYEVYGRNSMR